MAFKLLPVQLLIGQIGAGQIAPGAVGPGNISSLTATLIGNLGPLNANPYFTGGDGTGWKGSDGGSGSGPATFSITGTPPAGCPFPFAAKLSTLTVTGYSEMDGDIWPATPGAQYLIDGWAYSSSGQASFGFNWLLNGANVSNFTTTFTIPVNTWTHCRTVLTAPASGINQGRAEIDPNTDTAPWTIYAAGVTIWPQVPGGLIQANTITAAQILANTITAGQIAAGTITAAQIAANTITAAKIAANTITAAQIAANTITAGQIAANTITGAQIAASVALSAPVITGGTITGAQIIADGSVGEFLAYTGTPATGNLLVSISGAAGSDGHSNSFKQGLQVFGASGQYVLLNVAGGDAFATFSTGASEENAASTIAALITNPGTAEIMRLFIDGPQSNVASHTDWTAIWLSSAAKDGSSTAGGSLVYTDTSGVSHLYANWGPKGFRMQSGQPGDGNVYQGERMTVILNGSLTLGAAQQTVGVAFFEGVGQYVVEGQVMISPSAAGGTVTLEFVGAGGLVVSSSGITWSETLFGSPATPGSWSFTDPAVGSAFTTATLTTARRLVAFRGTINVTTAGTLSLQVASAAGAGTVNSRTSLFHVYPSGP